MQGSGYLRTPCLLILMIFIALSARPVLANKAVEVYLLAKLDDDRRYCLDIKGYQERAKVSLGLQAHTCYSYQGQVAVDQGFAEAKLAQGEFFISAFNVCMSSKANEGASVSLTQCGGQNEQLFTLTESGEIHPAQSDELCLMVALGTPRQGKGGRPPHLMRELSFERCSPELADYQKWGMRSNSRP